MNRTDKEKYKFLTKGFDTIQEAFNVKIRSFWQDTIKDLRAEADKVEHSISFEILDYKFQMLPMGAKGFSYKIESCDLQIFIRPLHLDDWNVTVRYLSVGLWLSGYEELEKIILKILEEISIKVNPEDWRRVTRADYCFDFYSPEFAKEIVPSLVNSVVCVSGVKINTVNTSLKEEKVANWGIASRTETLNIGTKERLQIGLYDKTREITEASGKTWFHQIWGNSYTKDVFRVEVRFFKDWLRDWQIITVEDLLCHVEEIVSTAINTRRLTIPSKDKNRSRWEIHPLWQAVLTANGTDVIIPKLGKIITERAEKLSDMFVKQIAGLIRNYSIVKYEEYFGEEVIEAVFEKVKDAIKYDENSKEKELKAKERYKFVKKPK